jgi:hypothetical protein
MYLILVIGHTGQGKTPYVNSALGNERVPVPGEIKPKYRLSSVSKKQYIFDLNNEYLLPIDTQRANFMRHVDCDINKFIETVKTLKGYNVVIEDATGFLRGRQSAEFARLLVAKMHAKNNYFILFHSLNRVPPELMEMANFVVLFKTNDNLDLIYKKFRNEKLNAAFTQLKSMKAGEFLTIKTV